MRAMRAEISDVALFGSMDRFGDLGIHAVLDLRRSFTREELEGAVAAAVRAFPVLGRRYEPRFWRDGWVPVDGPVSDAVHVVDAPADLEAETAAWARRPIDSLRERPLRLVQLRRGAGARMILSVTHLAVDGAGAAAVGHVLASHLYGAAPSAPTDPRRNVGSALEGLRLRHLPVLARDLTASLLRPFDTLRSARRSRPFPSDPWGKSSWRHLVISAEHVEHLKERCRPARVNDILIAALGRVAARRSGEGPLSVMYTMDLRRFAGSPRLSAANTSSIMQVLVPRACIDDLATTAVAVAKTTAQQHGSLAGPAYLLAPIALSFGAPHAWARGLARLLHPVLVDLPLSRGLVFTNVGRVDAGLAAFGEDLEELRIIGPNIRGVPVPAIVALGLRGAIHLELFAGPGIAASALEELEADLRVALDLAAGQAQSAKA